MQCAGQVTARNRVLFWADELSKGSLIHLAKDDTRAQHLTKVSSVSAYMCSASCSSSSANVKRYNIGVYTMHRHATTGLALHKHILLAPVLQVLKVQPGNQVKLGIINGKASTAQVLQTTPEVLLKCQDWQQPPTLQELHLILAMPRPKVSFGL